MKLGTLLALIPLTLLAACEPSPKVAARTGAAPRSGAPAEALDDRFGVTGATAGKGAAAQLRELGVGWIRIPVNWSQVEPRRGDYKWKQVSDAVQSRRRSDPDAHVMVTLRAKSPWASGPRPKGVKERATVPPADLDAYYDFVYGMAQRGKGVVQCWQIENEEEGQSWWAGSADQYLALLRTAHRAIRSADPSAKIALGGFTSEMTTVAAGSAAGKGKAEIARLLGHTGSVTSEGEARIRRNVEFMNTVLAEAGDYVDVVDIHLYNDCETIPMRVEWLRNAMRSHGYEKPIWATEVGGPDILVARYSEEAQAQEVVKRVVLALASGVEKIFWLGLTEMKEQGDRFNHLGLIAGNGRRKPAFNAYRAAIRTLAGLSYESSLPVPGGYGYRFAGSGGDGRAIVVLWADQATTYRLAESAPSIVLTGMDGRSKTVRTQAGTVALSLSPSPVLVTRGKP